MASAGPSQGGKRPMDMEINLVPFIDLLSCCIAFLMMVAVWTQIARIDVAPSPVGPAAEEKQDDDPLKLAITVGVVAYPPPLLAISNTASSPSTPPPAVPNRSPAESVIRLPKGL